MSTVSLEHRTAFFQMATSKLQSLPPTVPVNPGLAWACCGMRGWRQNMEVGGEMIQNL